MTLVENLQSYTELFFWEHMKILNYINFLMFLFFTIPKLYSNIIFICAIFTIVTFFHIFKNKDHWWGLQSESKRLIKTTLCFHLWTLEPISHYCKYCIPCLKISYSKLISKLFNCCSLPGLVSFLLNKTFKWIIFGNI